MNAKNWLVALAMTGAMAVGLWVQGAGAAEVKNVTAKYAWPWGVYINYEVVGTISTNDPLIVTATDRMKNVTYTASKNALSGDTGTAAGKHQLVWDLDKQGVNLQSTNIVFTVEYRGAWCVVDLSAGANASSYPVTYMNDPPSGGFNTDTYKTTKLVLRRIEPGSFKMGGSTQTTLSKPYYVGLFEVTQKQYELVMGKKPSQFLGDKRPVECVMWSTIRGTTNWPASTAVLASSFIGKLRARTGLDDFDLPTTAQWEYACRAGTTTTYSYGNSANGKYMWYSDNSSGQTHDVGSKQANPWGLYDMHGNVWEWCLDRDGGGADGWVRRGGDWGCAASLCTSSYWDYIEYMSAHLGFRLGRNPAE